MKTDRTKSIRAFTRIELLACISAVLVMALVQGAALSSHDPQRDRTLCISNHKQLVTAWLMYAADHDGALVPNPDGGDAGKTSSRPGWVGGWLDFRPATQAPDNIDMDLLMSYRPPQKYAGLLGGYLKTHKVFRCPSDPSVVFSNNIATPRVRSVALNTHMGQQRDGGRNSWSTFGYRVYLKLTDINFSPSEAMVTTDEHPGSLNDPVLAHDMKACMDPQGNLTPGTFRIIDYPGSFHEQGNVLSMADGHVEYWKWKDERTMPVVGLQEPIRLNVASPDNLDVARLTMSISRPE